MAGNCTFIILLQLNKCCFRTTIVLSAGELSETMITALSHVVNSSYMFMEELFG